MPEGHGRFILWRHDEMLKDFSNDALLQYFSMDEQSEDYSMYDGVFEVRQIDDGSGDHGAFSIYMAGSSSGGNRIHVDWGDGSDVQVITPTSGSQYQHTYTSEPGTKHLIKVSMTNSSLHLSRMQFTQTTDDTKTMLTKVLRYDGQSCTSYSSGFLNCVNLTYANCTNIHVVGSYCYRMFEGCTALARIKTDGDFFASNSDCVCQNMFKGCTSLVSIPPITGSGITIVKGSAFHTCNSLLTVSLPDTITTFNQTAFYQCYVLDMDHLPNSLTTLASNDIFNGCRELTLDSLPSGLTTYGTNSFTSCKKLALTSLPSGVTTLPNYCFYNCEALALTSLPSGLTSMGTNCFRNCYALPLTSLPSGMTAIPDQAFNCCYELALTSLPSGITSIGTLAFQKCAKLALTSLPLGITSVGTEAFRECTTMPLASIPSDWTVIVNNCFMYCRAATFTSIPDAVTSIGKYGFYYCTSAHFTKLPSSLTFIDQYAFAYSEALPDETYIPSGVTEIGQYAFRNCWITKAGLNNATLYFLGTPTTINSTAFSTNARLKHIYMPWASGAVAGAPWGATSATLHYGWTPPVIITGFTVSNSSSINGHYTEIDSSNSNWASIQTQYGVTLDKCYMQDTQTSMLGYAAIYRDTSGYCNAVIVGSPYAITLFNFGMAAWGDTQTTYAAVSDLISAYASGADAYNNEAMHSETITLTAD